MQLPKKKNPQTSKCQSHLAHQMGQNTFSNASKEVIIILVYVTERLEGSCCILGGKKEEIN